MVESVKRLALDYGVEITVSAQVTRIVCESGRAIAVNYHDKASGSTATVLGFDYVISDADYAHTELDLLDAQNRSYKKKYWDRRIVAPAMFVIYLGLSKKLTCVVHHNLYFAEDWEPHFETIFKTTEWPLYPCYYVSVASYDDSRVAPEGKENVFFLVPVAPGLKDTDAIREEFAEAILTHFEHITGENIRDSIEVKRIYSHRDFTFDYSAFRGTGLGLSHTLFQSAVFRPSMRSRKIKNLRYVGQYTHPGVGVPMAFIAAEILADSLGKEGI